MKSQKESGPRGQFRGAVSLVSVLFLIVAGALSWRSSLGGIGLWFKPAHPNPETPAIEIEPRHWKILAASRDAYLRDKTRLNSELTMVPSSGGSPDSIKELKIGELSPQSPIYVAGFRANDVIVSVNGTPVSTLSRAVNLANELTAAPRAVITVQRLGVMLDYTLEFE
jgi:membrane-associated protease RseP (regulator of RpoE activity)